MCVYREVNNTEIFLLAFGKYFLEMLKTKSIHWQYVEWKKTIDKYLFRKLRVTLNIDYQRVFHPGTLVSVDKISFSTLVILEKR